MSSITAPGAPATESAPGETNAPKVESSAEDVKPTTESEMAEDNKKATGASDEDIKKAVEAKKEEQEDDDAEPANEGQKEEKIVQDAVKQSALLTGRKITVSIMLMLLVTYQSLSTSPIAIFLMTRWARHLLESI